jgi:aldose 1-epimerase
MNREFCDAAPQPEHFGVTESGEPVDMYVLGGTGGLRLRVMTYGAIVLSVETPDRDGSMGDVALGFASLGEYEKENPYFGAVVGRYANRIAGGRFELGGIRYELACNNAPGGRPCALHGGLRGFDRVVWKGVGLSKPGAQGVRLTRISPDGEEGYPGNLEVSVTYWVTAGNEWRVEYEAVSDQPTPVNLTQHTFFNLAGENGGSVLGHEVQILASRFTPVDPGLIPTGDLRCVDGTEMDFREPHRIGDRIDSGAEQLVLGGGYDHTWVVDRSGPGLVPAARVREPSSGRTLEVLTTEPGIQFYSGNFLEGRLRGKSGTAYAKRGGFCLETQHFPDSPNQPSFPSTILIPGQRWTSETVFRFGTQPA